MSRFTDNAQQILDAAECALQTGHAITDVAILIDRAGSIRMVAGSDWSLEALGAHHGAAMSYRVSPSVAGVRVEGRSEGRKCLFETASPEQAARLLLGSGGGGLYRVVGA